ncbi:amidohydrolase [Roseinatronobacter monicus]|uniref:amidohydrolase n=1 Tax=Roseinatronobacter monicus TaxID=393481 RepID=UPI003F33408E
MSEHILTDSQIAALTHLRRRLHQAPEISGAEAASADTISQFLRATFPDQIVEGLGGHGLAVVYDSGQPGPNVMFRAELDALPIQGQAGLDYASQTPGVAHLCGHDGHMAILAGLGLWLGGNRPAIGRVILLFQPAEETGAGARAVLNDPKFATLRPDWAFALHNMPGMALGTVAVGAGPASCASVGLRLRFQGREAHASLPETGASPAPALAAVMAEVARHATAPPMGPDFRLATLCHLNMGVPAFGIAPAQAEAFVTLRTVSDSALERFEQDICAFAQAHAKGVTLEITRHDHFNATHNDPQAATHVSRACTALGVQNGEFALPMRASEDFGAFSAGTRTALFFLGAGEGHPALHNRDYDFPDALIASGGTIFAQILTGIHDETRKHPHPKAAFGSSGVAPFSRSDRRP